MQKEKRLEKQNDVSDSLDDFTEYYVLLPNILINIVRMCVITIFLPI